MIKSGAVVELLISLKNVTAIVSSLLVLVNLSEQPW
jgi:hypothetical protein